MCWLAENGPRDARWSEIQVCRSVVMCGDLVEARPN
jgi:hypothetical protein